MNRNAFIGRNVEILFKNSGGDNPSVIKKLQEIFTIEGRFLQAISTGMQNEKADVKLEFADGRNIDANVKAFKESSVSYNQLTRTSLIHFCENFDLNKYRDELFRLFAIKAVNKRTHLFPDNQKDKWQSIFQSNAEDILKWAFSYKKGREILVIYERDESIMSIYSMKTVLKNLDKQVEITNRGNILIGSSVVIQRKGGNGVHAIKIRKDDPKHPGNDIQIKMKMLEFMKEMESSLLTSYRI